MSYYEKVEAAAARLRGTAVPDVAIVLGSGLGEFAEGLADAMITPYAEIPNWPASAIIGHAGKLVIGSLAGRRVAALSGRAGSGKIVAVVSGGNIDLTTFASVVGAVPPA